MKVKILFIFFSMIHLSLKSQGMLSDINKTTESAIKIIDLFKKEKKEEVIEDSSSNGVFKSINKESSFKKAREINKIDCKLFCVENLNKKSAKIDIEYRTTKEKQTILVMSKDKSCLFDIPLGIYIIKVYQDDKLVKKTDYKIEDEEQETLTLPE